MNSEEIKYWVKLLNIPGVGPKTFLLIFKELQKQNKVVSDLFKLERQELNLVMKEINIGQNNEIMNNILRYRSNEDATEEMLKQLSDRGIKIISYLEQDYPEKLKQKLKENTPPLIYALGNKSLFKTRSVAIIGKRDASEEAIHIARLASERLATEGYNVISGYAKGVDTAASLGALECDGTTTIVLPYGILEFAWKRTFKEIRNFGLNTLVISQFYPNAKWQTSLAMQRNTIVIGLSESVLAIEFEQDGGTYNAIIQTLKMNIPVFIPKKYENNIRISSYYGFNNPIFIDIEDNEIDISPMIRIMEERNKQVVPEQLILIGEKPGEYGKKKRS